MRFGGAFHIAILAVCVSPVAAQMPDCWHYESGGEYIVGSVNTGHANHVAISGNYAYVAAGYFGLCVVDVSVPSNPRSIVWLGMFQRRVERVEVSGEYAFCVSNMIRPAPGFHVIDISDPEAPAFVSSCGVSGNIVNDLDISGNHAYVGLDVALSVFDIGDPTHALLVNEYSPGNNSVVRGVAVAENYAYIIWDEFTGPASDLGCRDSGHHARYSLEYSKDDSDMVYHLQVADISNPCEFVVKSDLEFPEPWGGRCVEVSGNYAYVGDWTGIQVVDVSDPANPSIVGSAEVPGEVVNGLAISGEFAYLAVPGTGLQVFGIADPSSPVLLGGTDITSEVKTVVVEENHLYLTNIGGLQILLVQCEEASGMEVAIDVKPGNKINNLNCKSRYGIVPVAILTKEDFDATTVNPLTVRFGPSEAAEAHENRHGPRRHEADVDHDGDTDLLFHFRFSKTGIQCGDTEATLTGMTYDGQTFSGTDRIRTVPGGSSADKLGWSPQISPNPFNPQTTISFSVDRLQPVKVAIFDLVGRQIATLTDQAYAPGTYSLIWEGKDVSGGAVSSGTYIVRLETESNVEARKMMLLR